jgi:ABC-type branched-subunit amino acid transport system ATPase component
MTGALVVSGLTLRHGARTVVDGVSFAVEDASIVGLVGPNGAGKTTVLDACSGLLRPVRGTILLNGRDITPLAPAERARLGLGRTFQQPRLFNSLTVLDNVIVGRDAARGKRPWGRGARPHTDRGASQSQALAALRLCGIIDLGDRPCTALTTAQRRLVEVARVLNGNFRVLMLDEPAAGLDATETSALAHIIRRAVAERRLTVLLIDHDRDLIASLCTTTIELRAGQIHPGGAHASASAPQRGPAVLAR